MTLTLATDIEGCPSGLTPPDLQAQTTDLTPFLVRKDNIGQLDLIVRGAKCGGCITKIETALLALPGVRLARLNLSSGHLRVAGLPDLSANSVADCLTRLGYGVSAVVPDDADKTHKAEERKLLLAMGVAGFAAANIMLLSVSVWAGQADMGEETRRVFHMISGMIAFPVILFSGRPFFASAWGALKHRHVNMDVPISLAVWLAFGTSMWETLSGGLHAYFDACVMLLFFLLIGRFLDARLRRRAFAAANGLAALQRQSVTQLINGTAQAVRASQIKAGDHILLAPGERAVIDMTISEGLTSLDESLITGETLPRAAGPGEMLYSGSVNLGKAIKGVARSVASDSLLSEIADLLEAGEQRRSTYRKIADRAVSLYVPFVHTTAILAFLGWLAMGASMHEAIIVAVSTLIITCPCALALAAPLAQVVASSRLFRRGVFLKSGDALERLATVDHIIFDKTGTLTLGTPQWLPREDANTFLEAAAKLARASRHPLSATLTQAAGKGSVAPSVTEEAGLGLVAVIDGMEHRLGSEAWVGGAPEIDHAGPVLWYRAGDLVPVPFLFQDEMHEQASKSVHDLKARGLSIEVLSGDTQASVSALAARLGLETWTAKASPKDKVTRLEDLRAQNRRVLMVGDGLNDAAALSLAHAALTPGTAMDISQSAADAVYTGGLDAIPAILEIAQRARLTMLENFTLAALYNLIAVPIAVTGHVTPLIAAIAMSASSLIVTLNALRMKTGKGG